MGSNLKKRNKIEKKNSFQKIPHFLEKYQKIIIFAPSLIYNI